MPAAQVVLTLQSQVAPQIAQTADAYKRLAAEEQKAEQASVRYALAQSKVALVDAKVATEEQKLATQVANTAKAESAAELAALRLATAHDKAANSGAGNANSLKGIQSALAGLGFAFGIQQLLSFGIGATKAANSLEKTESTTAALSGSTARYIQVLALAKSGQTAYGGSLEENLRGLGTLVNLSNRAGVELGKLDNISRRLAIVDPVQGIEGANIALKEFLSGDNAEAALSLARRFELPRAALAALAKEGVSAKDRLTGLDALLNQQGITTQVLTDRTKTTAATYDQLGASAENAKTRVGGFIAELLKVPAKNITLALNLPDDITSKKADLGSAAVTGAQNFTQYQIAVKKADAELLKTFGTYHGSRVLVDGLTQAQFDYAKSLELQGTATSAAVAKAQALAPVFAGIAAAQQHYRDTAVASAEGASQLGAMLLRVAASGDVGRAGAESLILAYNNGKLSLGQLQNALAGLEAQQARNTVLTQNEEREQRRLSGAYFLTADSVRTQAAALAESASKAQTATLESKALGDTQAQIASIGKSVFAGLLSSADGARILEDQYKFTSIEAERLIRNQTQIAGNANAAKAQDTAVAFRRQETGGGFLTTVQQQAAIQKQAAAEAARAEGILQNGTHAQKLSQLKQQLAEAIRTAGAGSAAAIRAQNAVTAEIAAAAAAADKGGRAQVSAAQRALTLQEGIYDSVEKQRDAMLDIEELTIRDRQQDRADVAKKRAAEAILADPRKARLHDAARDALALIDVQDRKRANELAGKGATAGAQIINGKLIQSAPGGALPLPAPSTPLALPSPGGLPGKPGAAAGGALPGVAGGVQVLVYLDGAPIAANVVTRLRAGLAQHDAGGG